MRDVLIIAEAGVNHNGSMEMALRLIDVARDAGADVVKFQTFTAENVISLHAPKAEYQIAATGVDESQFEMVRKLQLSVQDHHRLVAHCAKRGIEFLSTPFDLDSIDFLVRDLKLETIKVPSGEITNVPYLLRVARSGRRLIMSTGMSTLEEVQTALGVLAFGVTHGAEARPTLAAFQDAFQSAPGQAALRARVSLLHCTTEYPSPFDEVNLLAMDTLKDAFGLPVGLSDHTPGIAVPLAAVARGARIIEKHFTLDTNMPGPDHKASLNPVELGQMVMSIRQVEQALGSSMKRPSASELKNIPVARKSIVASKAIRKGEIFSEGNLTTKRPGSGISALYYWDYIGKPAERDYLEDELIS